MLPKLLLADFYCSLFPYFYAVMQPCDLRLRVRLDAAGQLDRVSQGLAHGGRARAVAHHGDAALAAHQTNGRFELDLNGRETLCISTT